MIRFYYYICFRNKLAAIKKMNSKKKIKGPSLGYTDNHPNRSMWKEIASELDGEFKIKHNSGHELEIHEITIPHNKWIINLSVSDTRPLKIKISFNTNLDFNFTISWEDIIEKILKRLGKKEVELGNDEFDKKYLIVSNKADLLREIVTKDIQDVMLKYNIYSLSYHTDKKIKTSELLCVIQRKAGNKEMIMEIIDLFKLLINNLEKTKLVM